MSCGCGCECGIKKIGKRGWFPEKNPNPSAVEFRFLAKDIQNETFDFTVFGAEEIDVVFAECAMFNVKIIGGSNVTVLLVDCMGPVYEWTNEDDEIYEVRYSPEISISGGATVKIVFENNN